MSLRNLLAAVILLSVGALAVTLLMNLPGEKREELLEVLPKEVDLALEKIHYTQTEAGQRRWTLDAESAAYQRQEGLISLKNVSMTFYSAGPYEEVVLSAENGLFDQLQGQVNAWGNVQIATDRDEHFFADKLSYAEEKRLVSSEGEVRMSSPRLELVGTGFRLWLEAGKMSLLQNVQARIMTETTGREEL